MREENEQNTQVLTFKMEQIAAMQQATQEMEEKLAQVTAELEKAKAVAKPEKAKPEKAKLEKSKPEKETGKSKTKKLEKSSASSASKKEEKPKKKTLFARKVESSSSDSNSVMDVFVFNRICLFVHVEYCWERAK